MFLRSGLYAYQPQASVGLKWVPFMESWYFGQNLKRVYNEKVLVDVTPSVFLRCEDLTKKPGKSNEVCHKRFTIVPLNTALPLLLWKHTFRPLNLLHQNSIEHKGANCPQYTFRLVQTYKWTYPLQTRIYACKLYMYGIV